MRWLAAALLLASSAAQAAPVLNPIFADHGVLQSGRPISVWGTASPGEQVNVTLGSGSASATADRAGAWHVRLPAMQAGGPYALAASSASGRAVANDVLVGDVWLCSGQSNMELQVSRALNSYNDTQSANDPELRILTVPRRTAGAPQTAIPGLAWQAVTPGTIGDFSAACYYMVRELRGAQRAPMGAIADSWGGTQIRSWMDDASIAAIGDDDARLFALGRRDPAGANARFGEIWGAWWRTHSGDAPGAEPWHASDRLHWTPVPAMTYWEQWGDPNFASFNGMVWMRARVTLSAAEAAQAATLSLGVIDELDQSFVNGVAVGNRYSWEAPRDYAVPRGLLHAGVNEILVNIFDGSGAGGFAGPAERLHLTLADGSVKPLTGWEYSVAHVNDSPPRAPWDEAMGLTAIYNGMIAPLGDYGLSGVAWYQGEADVGLPGSYADRLGAMMATWRRQFGRPDLPFLIVSLANFGPFAIHPVESGWAALREQQRLAVARDPHAALAIAMDLGERLDIHPGNKQEVGRRLARGARLLAYGAHEPMGPEVAHAARTPNGIVVTFSGVTGALHSWSSNVVTALELCGPTPQSCRYVEGRADGSSVRIPDDGRPATRVRYGWADSPVTNLYDEVPLPVGPFEVQIN
ncbi:MAG: 9-O-acetylesterase [Sphingomonadaceae bacterium]|nr:9-O-acetylesterase [Sphingomonadaceae bacterium]